MENLLGYFVPYGCENVFVDYRKTQAVTHELTSQRGASWSVLSSCPDAIEVTNRVHVEFWLDALSAFLSGHFVEQLILACDS
eukprot:Skav219259  [mRNA]  locus=scaffold1242:411277:411522:- [translate_table: standard]